MRRLNSFVMLLIGIAFSLGVSAQHLTFSAQGGYSGPQGDAFRNENTGDGLTSFGLGYEVDAMLTLPSSDDKLAVGLLYSGNIIFRKQIFSVNDLVTYGLALYGIKGQYRLLSPDRRFSPYASLGIGLSEFSLPKIIYNNQIPQAENVFSFGLKPEIGMDFSGLLISASYFVPMRYEIDFDTGDFVGTAGTFCIFMGYRYYFGF